MLTAQITYRDKTNTRGVLSKSGEFVGCITDVTSPRFNMFKLKSYRGRSQHSIVTIDTGETFEVNTQNVKLFNKGEFGHTYKGGINITNDASWIDKINESRRRTAIWDRLVDRRNSTDNHWLRWLCSTKANQLVGFADSSPYDPTRNTCDGTGKWG